MKRLGVMLLMAAALWLPTAHAVEVQAFVKKDRFDDIKLSPNGDYYAATIALEDRTSLAILRRSDNKVTAAFNIGKNTHVTDFVWVNPERLLISAAEKFGDLDMPLGTGELFALSVNGNADILVGQRVQGEGPGTLIKKKKVEKVIAELVDDLPGDDKTVVISVSLFAGEPFVRAEKMNVYTGQRIKIATVPVRRARFYTDQQGAVRFARGAGSDNVTKLFYRDANGVDWRLVNDESASGHDEWPVGFSEDGLTAYLEVQQVQGPNAIVSMDVQTQVRKEILRDSIADPATIVYRNGTRIPIGAFFMNAKPRTMFFDATAPEARLYRSLERAFAAEAVRITSQTADGRLALVEVWSDRNPGDFYVFDTVSKKAELLISRKDWFDPAELASTRPISLKTRDGLDVHGFLTTPPASEGKNLPMVVMPHGGPFGIQDVWGFDSEVQMLANAGYGVLQINFRGSGGFGRSFTHAGAKQWGKAMQDDLTDATRWAIEQGIADRSRVCIYGASYGGYAALMGAAREPDLYKCAAGYVGVYDLSMMHTHGDIQQWRSGETYLREWLGEGTELASTSPARLAERIRAPVFLAAGGEDERAPIAHTKAMEKALKTAGVPVESLYYDTEGHGFYLEEHKREYYTRLLAFLSKHLGGALASNVAPEARAAK